MSTMEHLLAHLKDAEGFRQFPYKCPADKWTIGYGFNIEDRGIPKEVAEFWLQHELNVIDTELEATLERLDISLDRVRYSVLLDMAFNLGTPRLLGFKKMLTALQDKDYEKAAVEMLDSRWARQVGRRARKLSQVMRKGRWV